MVSTESILTECEKTLNKEFLLNSPQIIPSLLTGHGGVALFYAYYYQLMHDLKYLKICRRILDNILKLIEKEQMLFTFCDGLAGIGWLIQHLIDMEVINSENYNLEEFDKYLNSYSLFELNKGNYDFLHGGIGAGIYFVNRPIKFSFEYLKSIVNVLYETAIFNNKGIYWLDKYITKFDMNDKRPRVNFGLAHGLPSIIYFLSKVFEHGILKNKVEYLLRGTIDFIMSNRIEGAGCFFPHFYFIDKSNSGRSRLAWCYGDLAVISSFFIASKALNDNYLLNETQRIALLTSKRIEYNDTRLFDGGLCHGYAGVSLIYKKFYDFTNEANFIEISNYWYDLLIGEIKKSGGPQNFRTYYPNENIFVKSYDFLTGLTGAAFLIMMYNNNHLSGFEKCLLLS